VGQDEGRDREKRTATYQPGVGQTRGTPHQVPERGKAGAGGRGSKCPEGLVLPNHRGVKLASGIAHSNAGEQDAAGPTGGRSHVRARTVKEFTGRTGKPGRQEGNQPV
jgi:hypothetical protein